jgi:hypothetical protein
MAKQTGSSKTTFGKRKKGKAKKSYNKNDRKSRVYIGQGR